MKTVEQKWQEYASYFPHWSEAEKASAKEIYFHGATAVSLILGDVFNTGTIMEVAKATQVVSDELKEFMFNEENRQIEIAENNHFCKTR